MRFDFQSPWKTYKVDNIIESCGGGTPSTKVISYWQGDIPWISSSDLFENNIRDINVSRYVTKEAIKCSATKLCPKETICIVSRVGVGKVAVTTEPLCTSQDFMNITHFDGNKYFLAQLIQNKIKSSQLQGTSIKGITSKEIKDMRLFIPSRAEQDKIKLFLQKLDERIETQIKIIKDLKIQKAKIRQTEILNVSTNRILVLNQLCNIKTGKKDANQMKSNGTYKFFTCSREDYYIDTYSFEGDSLIISGNGEIGLIKYYSGKFDAYQRTYVLQNFECDPLYLKLVLEEKLPKIINKEKNVGAMPYIVLSTLSNITIPLPDLQTQTKIQINIGVLDKKIKIESQLLNKFEIQKKFLLNNMFI